LKRWFILLLMVLSSPEVLLSANTTNSGFDMKGTITNVLSPSSIVIGSYVVNLVGVDASGLYRSTYVYLMEDLKSYYIGKDVLVKGNYTYFDLQGSYNSESINEMIQKEISDMQTAQDYGKIYGRYYGRSSDSSNKVYLGKRMREGY
jgi:hypothetical protein